MEQERAYLLALPGTRFENTKVVGVRISPYQTAQVDQKPVFGADRICGTPALGPYRL